MPVASNQMKVYLEIGKSRVFAIALDWPGWCRSGRDEASALQALIACGPRYERVLEDTQLGFVAPSSVSDLFVMEHFPGNATTDFGAPDISLPADEDPVGADDLMRWQVILKAGWKAIDQTVENARGKSLRKGPRGGGRNLDKIAAHIREVEIAYLGALGGKISSGLENDPDRVQAMNRVAILESLVSASHGEFPAIGPRGGKRWSPRYFVRRFTWHLLDHVWEIEDRVE
jgi:hypothetical protein